MLISLVAKINELSHSQLAIDEPTLSASGCIKIGYGINIGAGGDITASLGHQADTTLRLCRLKRVDVVHERRLGRYLNKKR